MKRAAIAVIDEARCIGCTLCLPACPVDAIVGARGLMHTVIEVQCIGCKLCLSPCPVDCIAMVPLPPARQAWTNSDAAGARARAKRRKVRLAREPALPPIPGRSRRRAVVREALARARAKRG